MKKLNVVKNKMKFFFEIFLCKNHPPMHHMKDKVMNFAPRNKSIMTNKPPSTILERFL